MRTHIHTHILSLSFTRSHKLPLPGTLQDGWNDGGILTWPIYNLPGVGPLNQAGTAYIYVTYNRRLYITMTFNCNFLLSTDPVGTIKSVEVALWSYTNTQPQ